MGYSQSKKSLERVRPVLDMLAVNDRGLLFPSNTPLKLRDAVFTALNIVSKLPEESEDKKKYGHIRAKFTIRLQENGVLFERKQELHFDNPIEALAASRLRELTFDDIHDLTGVVGVMIKEKAEKFTFPNILISQDDRERLLKWCRVNGYSIPQILPLTIVKDESSQNTNTLIEE